MSVLHLMKRAAEAGDQRAIEGLKILKDMAAEAAIFAVEDRIEVAVMAGVKPVIDAQQVLSKNLREVGRLLFIGTTPAVAEPEPLVVPEPPAVGDDEGMLPDPPEDIFLDEEDVDAAWAAEDDLPESAQPVDPGTGAPVGEPPAEPDDEQ